MQVSRAQRRALEAQNRRQPERLEPIPSQEFPSGPGTGSLLRAWRSRGFLVQEFPAPAPALVRLSVCRTAVDVAAGRWVDGITWEELQEIKAQVGYGAQDAVEVFPASADVINVANMRHLWVMQEPLVFAWRR